MKILKLSVVFLYLVLIAGVLFYPRLVDKIQSDAVRDTIEEIKRSYSPSPYGPGLDPDKVDVIRIKEGTDDKID
jgi:hypothetical protein